MRNLLNFIIRYGRWFVFAFYVLLSCVLLVSNNSYQHSIFLTSANVVSNSVYSVASEVTGYFHLKSINESLQASNAMLETEVLNLRHQLDEYKTLLSDSVENPIIPQRFDYVQAAVINNSVRHPRNYFSINRGSKDGVKVGMGVVDQNGIVGIVNVAGPKTSRVISILNETQHFSVRLKNTNFIGSLSWKGGDPSIAYMEQVPRHARYHAGDTVVTSGYSTTFPADIPVGIVMNRIHGSDDNFFILKIRLNSDFKALSTVRVIKDEYKAELDSLQSFDFTPAK
ncbi:MAG: rod shape-determining protein MreC [Muribaculaceae bacterium]|nr:rod shape-determining protein MreC [Muribaculaceae bacterium]MDE6754018.1 rod shape-determining protein MreC [Muribaculaceae bacterium]